jgi:predicted LPLAT superfamily acyltransferase
MRFAAASADLELLRQRAPSELEKVYAEYRARLEAYAIEPPPADWDGSYRAEHK